MLLILLSLEGPQSSLLDGLLPFWACEGHLFYLHMYFHRNYLSTIVLSFFHNLSLGVWLWNLWEFFFSPNVSHLLRKLGPLHIILSKTSFHLSFVHSPICSCTQCGVVDIRALGTWSFISRVRSFERLHSFVPSSKAKFMARLQWPFVIQEKERFGRTALFLFHPSLFPRIPSMEKCVNWGCAVICQVGPEPPAVLLPVSAGCLFPAY